MKHVVAVAALQAEVARVVTMPAVRDRFRVQDAEMLGSTPDAFATYIRAEVKLWTDVIRTTGVEPK